MNAETSWIKVATCALSLFVAYQLQPRPVTSFCNGYFVLKVLGRTYQSSRLLPDHASTAERRRRRRNQLLLS